MRRQSFPTRNKTKFCGFHWDYGHLTEDCIQLKRAIEWLIWEGCLKEYVASAQQQKDKGERIINMINPKLTSVKKIKKRIYNFTKSYLVLEYGLMHREAISFSNKELEHNEEAKITLIVFEVRMIRDEINKWAVRRVLVDTGATKNIMYLQCFKKMGLEDDHLKASKMVLEGFTTHKIPIKWKSRCK